MKVTLLAGSNVTKSGGVRPEAVATLSWLPSDARADTLIDTLDDDGREDFDQALAALGIAASALGAPAARALGAVLVERLCSSRWRFSRRMAIARVYAAVLGDESHNRPLLRAMKSIDDADRAVAAIALGFPGNRAAFEPLRCALRGPSARVRQAALEGMCALDDTRVTEVLSALLALSPPEGLRRAIVRHLRQVPGDTAERALVAQLYSSDVDMRLLALAAFKQRDCDEARQGARHLLHDPDPRVRVQALGVLERGDAQDAQAVIPLLADPDDRVKRTARDTLLRLRAGRPLPEA